ncbi:MAG TPA: type II CAAX endopeptidase family protein [Candidatus Sulfopaludibacter sp.]|nr:type II CAAX endopeptidase family protein [Candidatus Sulfopaludibacter sp.]
MASHSARRIAPVWHTVLVLLAIAGITGWGKIYSDHLRAIANSPRLPLYATTAVFEWALLGLVLWGAPANIVMGPRWTNTKRIVFDVLIAAGFWIVSGILLVVLSRLLGATSLSRNVKFMLPRTPLEMAAWVALCVTAGICEEAVFRGYLQPQFGGLTGSSAAGILLSAVIFGAGHAYQGWRSAVLIACYGAMFGLLAKWRRTTRPGMIAHFWQDCVSGLLGS